MVTLIGRDTDLDAVAELLEARPLVTILGPAGVGKTSLARAIAEDREHVFVELAGIDRSEVVVSTVLGRIGFSTVDVFSDWLAERPQLMVLDNCEHVLDGVAELVDLIRSASPDSTILATSRMPLDAAGEFVFVLRPLEVNPDDAGGAAPSVELFLERANAAGAGTPDLDAVHRLCARLDGMPLAIEIAAARARSMTPDEILGHLDLTVDVLSRRTFRGESRHRSLRAAIDWSYNLLDADMQRLVRALSIFSGAFTAELAHAVCGLDGEAEFDTLDRLATLVDASLLTSTATMFGTRYGQLDSIRAYARQRLEEAGETGAVKDRYVDQVLMIAAGHVTGADRPWGADLLAGILALVDDLLATITITLDDPTPDRAYMLMTVLWAAVHQSRSGEIAAIGEVVLDCWSDVPHPMRVDAIATTATAIRELGDGDRATELALAALPDAASGIAAPVTLNRLLALTHRRDDPNRAMEYGQAAIDAAIERGLTPFRLELEVFQAQALGSIGRKEEARAKVAAVLDITGPDDVNHIWAQLVDGILVADLDRPLARSILRQALEMSTKADYWFGIGAALRLLGALDAMDGDFASGAKLLVQAIDHNVAVGAHAETGVSVLTAGMLLRKAGHPDADTLIASGLSWSGDPLIFGVDLSSLATTDIDRSLGVAPLTARRLARSALVGLASEDTSSPASMDEVARLVRQGDVWEVTYLGETVVAKHGKGWLDIAQLLQAPRREIHVLDLIGAAVVESAADDAIDATAMAAYRERVRELQSEIDTATGLGDLGRVETAQAEMDALVDQLTAAYGLGGRARKTTGTAERARSTVTQRIRSVIKRLAETHPPLHRHFRAAITTGVYCSYTPERPISWTVDF